MRILILGAAGTLGSTVFNYLSRNSDFSVMGTVRSKKDQLHFPIALHDNLLIIEDLLDETQLTRLLDKAKPDYVINCVGLIKQLPQASSAKLAVGVNAYFPHLLAFTCTQQHIRLIHFSTDCVFSGLTGNYCETDQPDAEDLYGRSKLLGELVDDPLCITLRTSLIGPELETQYSLLNWFLAQKNSVKGYQNTFFSGLTTLEIAKVLEKIMLSPQKLHGLYHLSADRISKYDLLELIKQEYLMKIDILPDDLVVLDRSLNSDRLRTQLGYVPPSWKTLIQEMHAFQEGLQV